MCDFSFEYGIVTVSWCAEFAFRIRVRKSAIGSVMVMRGPQPSLAGVSARRRTPQPGLRRLTPARTYRRSWGVTRSSW
ncbi:hypothetical protein Cma02nite_32640 [Cellulomonas marina]|nr:hypothetical protein Cma02nite_32640 [Cellulomonas marina]